MHWGKLVSPVHCTMQHEAVVVCIIEPRNNQDVTRVSGTMTVINGTKLRRIRGGSGK